MKITRIGPDAVYHRYLTINNGKAPYFSAGMRVIGEAAISRRLCIDKGGKKSIFASWRS